MGIQKVNAHFTGCFLSSFLKVFIVRIAGSWKSGPELIIIRSHERILSSKLWDGKVVADAHNVTDIKVWVQSTGSICHDDYLDTKTSHNVDRENNSLHIMTLIGVEPSAIAHGGDTTQVSEHDFSLVPGNGAMSRKARNVGVLDSESFALESI
jgi:hypothetical protein